LLLSQGVPMIAHGDELGRTQHGNNNVYCQNNELSWIDWADARDNDLVTEFTARLLALRRAHPVFRRQRFFQSRPIHGSSVDDIAWLRPDGQQMSDQDWTAGYARTVAIFLNGQGIPDRDAVGERVVDDSFLLLINAHHQQITFTLPDESYGRSWETVIDTADPLLAHSRRRPPAPRGRRRVPARAMQVLRRRY
jgi:glycogen operon protein